MADKMMDRQDEYLSALFASPAIEDDGFSARVMRRIRRQLWINRLALPVAVILGAAIAINPLLDLLALLPSLATLLPEQLQTVPWSLLPDARTLAVGAILLMGGLGLSLLADD